MPVTNKVESRIIGGPVSDTNKATPPAAKEVISSGGVRIALDVDRDVALGNGTRQRGFRVGVVELANGVTFDEFQTAVLNPGAVSRNALD